MEWDSGPGGGSSSAAPGKGALQAGCAAPVLRPPSAALMVPVSGVKCCVGGGIERGGGGVITGRSRSWNPLLVSRG